MLVCWLRHDHPCMCTWFGHVRRCSQSISNLASLRSQVTLLHTQPNMALIPITSTSASTPPSQQALTPRLKPNQLFCDMAYPLIRATISGSKMLYKCWIAQMSKSFSVFLITIRHPLKGQCLGSAYLSGQSTTLACSVDHETEHWKHWAATPDVSVAFAHMSALTSGADHHPDGGCNLHVHCLCPQICVSAALQTLGMFGGSFLKLGIQLRTYVLLC